MKKKQPTTFVYFCCCYEEIWVVATNIQIIAYIYIVYVHEVISIVHCKYLCSIVDRVFTKAV